MYCVLCSLLSDQVISRRCFPLHLDTRSPLSVSSILGNSQGHSKAGEGECQLHSGDSMVTTSVVVCPTHCSLKLQILLRTTPSRSHRNGKWHHMSPRSESNHVEHLSKETQTLQICQNLEAPHKLSTVQSYRYKWVAFCSSPSLGTRNKGTSSIPRAL